MRCLLEHGFVFGPNGTILTVEDVKYYTPEAIFDLFLKTTSGRKLTLPENPGLVEKGKAIREYLTGKATGA